MGRVHAVNVWVMRKFVYLISTWSHGWPQLQSTPTLLFIQVCQNACFLSLSFILTAANCQSICYHCFITAVRVLSNSSPPLAMNGSTQLSATVQSHHFLKQCSSVNLLCSSPFVFAKYTQIHPTLMSPNRLLKFACPLHRQGCSRHFRSQAGCTCHICTIHTNHNVVTVTPPQTPGSPSHEPSVAMAQADVFSKNGYTSLNKILKFWKYLRG